MAKINHIIALSADHGGFQLKEELIKHLQNQGFQVIDCGTNSSEAVDYPKFAFLTAQTVSEGKATLGIIIDGAGIGSAMTANKVKRVRAALCYDLSSARNAREHNNANILTLGAGLIGLALAKQIVDLFIATECTAERHLKRVQMIDDLDQGLVPTRTIECSLTNERNPEAMELSTNDVSRIALRVQEMLGGVDLKSAIDTSAGCGNPSCTDCGHCAERTPETIRKYLDLGANRFSHALGGSKVPQDLGSFIDHTLLKPAGTVDEIKKLCAEAREYNFASVCIHPSYVALAARELAGCRVKVCTVVGFPLGANLPEIKSLETRRAIRDGAREIDMVINIGALKSKDYHLVYRDLRMVTEACEDGGATSKVIIEAALLTDEEKVKACELAMKARANYVKTSTGFGPGGATERDVALMSRVVSGKNIGVKAAGGIKDYQDATKMIAAGATRLGASAGIKILQGAKEITISN